MANFVSLESLLQLWRDATGLSGDAYWRDERITRAINQGVQRYWRELNDGDGGYGRARTTVTAVADTETIALPEAVRQLVQLERPCTGTAEDYRAADRITVYSDPGTDLEVDLSLPGAYYLEGQTVLLRPVPVVAEVVRLIYETTAPVLALATDEIDCIEGYELVIVFFGAYFAVTDSAKRREFAGLADREIEDLRRRRNQRDRGGPDYARNYRQRLRKPGYRP